MADSPRNPADHRFLTDLIRQRGWPLTKAAYVKAMDYPHVPTFPLDAETLAMVPLDLPGPMPTSPADLWFSPKVLPQPSQTLSRGGRRLDAALVRSTAARHGLTLEEAEQALKDFGG